MPSTRFSIVITFCNQREFIKDAVDSAVSMPGADREIIVVDDASTDGTPDILEKYGDAIQLVRHTSRKGAGVARNSGAALAKGDYLLFLDGDDTFLPWTLDVYANIVRTKQPKLILAPMWWFKDMLPVLKPEDTPREIHTVEYQDYLKKDRSFALSASAMVIDRQSFQNAQGWSPDLWPANDNDFILRLCNCGRTIQILSPPTTFHRSHATNTVKNIPPYVASLFRIIRNERAGEYPGGKGRSRERRAIIGGMVFAWAQRAAKAGHYGSALKLLAGAWRTVWAALTRRLGVLLNGRQPDETFKM